ncbi:MAG TPA: copper resistance protein CopC [Candidatus Limnocylindrales bacterium]|jgi:methionine-rich copper-binding protein CopC
MTPRRPRRSVAAVAFATLTLFLVPSLAVAHAELDTVTPKDKSTVEGTPTIKMTFTQALDPAKSSITLVDSGGAIIDGSSAATPGASKTMTFTPNGDLAPGTYTIRWTSASAEDGDIARGTTTFTVAAAASASPSEEPTASASPSAEASAAASVAPSDDPSPSAAPSASPVPTTPASSTSDALIPIVVVLVVLAGLGIWLLRGRGGASG